MYSDKEITMMVHA